MSYIEKIEANKVLDLKQIVPIEEEQMLSKTLVQRKDLGMTVFSLDKGQEIGRHSLVDLRRSRLIKTNLT